jgi:RHS repeat-associated protein
MLNLARVAGLFIALTLFAANANAYTSQWQWTVSGSSTQYKTKGQAVAAMRSLNAYNAFLKIENPDLVSEYEMRYRYTAPIVPPVPTTDWSYSASYVTGYFTTEAEVVAAQQAIISARDNGGCANGTLQTDGGWGSIGDYYGVSRQEARTYKLVGQQGHALYPTPHCFGMPDSPYSFWRSRNVLCPAYHSPTSTAPHCQVNTFAYVTGRPLPCCEATEGNPIDVAVGDKTETVTDYASGALRFTRFYHSATEDSFGKLGIGWTHSFNARIVMSTSAAPLGLIRPSGSQEPLRNIGTNSYTSRAGTGLEVRLVGTEWVVYGNDGKREYYNAQGVLLRVDDLGQVVTLGYLNGLLSTVRDDFGHVLTFNYTDNLLTGIDDPAGNSITYAYDPATNNLTGVTYPGGNSVQYVYENTSFPNHLTGIVDESGVRYATFGYDSDGRATSTQHAGGVGSYVLSYGSTSTTVTTPLGTTSSYQFSTEDRARKVTQYSIGGLTQATAIPLTSTDAQRRPTQKTDARGIVTTFAYDAHHLLSKTEAYGTAKARTTSYQYLSNDTDLPTLITEPNRTTVLTYNTLGSVLTRTVTDTATSTSRTWTRTYDGSGRVLTDDGPRTDVADTSVYTYYSCTTGYECGQLHTVTNALGHVTTFNIYNAHGQPLTITDPNGVVTTLTYDGRLRLTSQQVGSETTAFTYWPAGLLKKVTQPDGSYLLYTYDNAHRLISVEDGEGNRVEYTLDAMGNRTAESAYDPSSALSRSRAQVFNSLNQLWKQVGSAGTSAVTTTFAYDNNGNQTDVVAPLGRSSTNQYDELNRLQQITDPGSGVTLFGYDANDNLTSVTDPRNKVTSYTYNGLGDMTQLVSPDTGTTVNTFDSGGNLATATDARSKTGTYSYDVLNRVAQLAYPDRTIAFTYDAGTHGVGRLSGASDANHSLGWTYDAQGRVASKTQTVGAVTLAASYGYTNGNLTSLTTPSGQTIGYTYADGRISGITLNGGATILDDVLYEPFGPLRQWTWGNSSLSNRTYDLDGNPNAIDSEGATTYSVDDAFRITGVTDLNDSSRSWTYGYDSLDRLTSASRAGQTIGLTYDANGNRLTQTGTVPATYTVSSTSNRVTSIAGSPSRTYAYDSVGNTVGFGALTFTYDDSGRMRTATSGGVTTSYTLNALGQRVKKSNASTTRLFVYDEAGHLLGEYDGAGALIQETVWLNDVPVATLRPSGGGMGVFYVHTDHLNTPRRISRPSDNVVVWRWDSDPFGTDAANEDPDGDSISLAYNLRLPGQYFDSESGLHYNYLRDGYDPAIGRYTQSDPIGLKGGINTYAYTFSSPLLFADPSGLDVYRGPGHYYSDIPPNTGCERAAISGGYITGWGPCASAYIPPPRASRREETASSCAVDQPEDFDWGGALWDAFGPDWTWLLPELKAVKIAGLIPLIKLRRIHSTETITSGIGKHSYNYWSRRSTDDIIKSLRPGSENPLMTSPDGAIFDGNTRIYILEQRGIDVSSLPRVPKP